MAFQAVFPDYMHEHGAQSGGKQKQKQNVQDKGKGSEKGCGCSTPEVRGGRGQGRGRWRGRGRGRGHGRREADQRKEGCEKDDTDDEEYDEEDTDAKSISSESDGKKKQRGVRHWREREQKDHRNRRADRNTEGADFRGSNTSVHRHGEGRHHTPHELPPGQPRPHYQVQVPTSQQQPPPPLFPPPLQYPGACSNLPPPGYPYPGPHLVTGQTYIGQQPYGPSYGPQLISQPYGGPHSTSAHPPGGQQPTARQQLYEKQQPAAGQYFRPSPSSGQTYGNPVNERGQSYRPATQKEVPDFQPQFRRQGSLPSLAGDRTKQSRKEKPKHLEKNNLEENSNKGGNLKQKDKKETKIEKQAKSNVQETKTNVQKADLDTDEWQQVFTFLLREFDGQTKFGTLMSKKDQLLKGLNHAEAAEWLKRNSSKFLVFEKEGKIKYVSVFFRSAKLCFNHRNPEYISCRNEKCTFFHVCRDFISGSCPRGTDCRFSHNFHSPTNQKVCHELGLQNFTNDDIRKIILCSNPSVCEKYNRSGCNGDDCLHLHVCAEHVQQKCTAGESCKKSHSVKSIEHNQWVLKAFNLAHLPEGVLNKMLIMKRDSEKKSGPDAKQKQFTKSKPPKESKGIVMTNPPQELEHQGEELSSSPLFLLNNPTEGGEQGQDNNEGSDKGKKQFPTPRKSKKSRGQKIKIPNSAQGEPEDEAGRGHQGQQDTWIAKGDPDAGDDENQFEADIPSVPQTFTNNPALEIEDVEGVQGQQHASQYAYLCEMYSCTGDCPTGFLCPYYHHRRKIMYQWQIYLFECWYDFSETDSYDIERCFCTLSVQETFEVVLEGIGELRLTIDFDAMEATVEDSFGDSVVSSDQVPVQRWSTRSYIEADPAATLSYYTQWIWYCQDDTGCFLPFNPERLQYTLEEKYVRGQQKYYYEQDNARFVLHFNERGRVNLDNHSISRVMRRPVFIESHETTAPVMSELLLLEKPTLQHPVQLNWNCVDKYQDFELLELDATGAEFQDVAIKFHASLDRRNETILTIFRIQNPALWDTYCSKKRAMTPRDMTDKDVDERQLFHGTPTLDAVRGICANNMDFRRSGENVGAKYGKGSYFSTSSLYSHSYTRVSENTCRFMFLARVLVGKYTLGEESFSFPPIREGLKRYDSCVNDQNNPQIFVIFDLAQSYPEYLIQYKDVQGSEKAYKLTQTKSQGSLPMLSQATGIPKSTADESYAPSQYSSSVSADISAPELKELSYPMTSISSQGDLTDTVSYSPDANEKRPVPAPRKSRLGNTSSATTEYQASVGVPSETTPMKQSIEINLLEKAVEWTLAKSIPMIQKDEKCILS